MRRRRAPKQFAMMLLALLLVACDAYTETGVRSRNQQGMSGGVVSASARKANGTSEKEIEIEVGGVSTLEADATLTVGSGTFRLELLGGQDQVTLTLEAHSGQTVSGHGQMAVSLGKAYYRVTAGDAEDVEYTIQYTFR